MNELKISERFRLICPVGRSFWTGYSLCKNRQKDMQKQRTIVRCFFCLNQDQLFRVSLVFRPSGVWM